MIEREQLGFLKRHSEQFFLDCKLCLEIKNLTVMACCRDPPGGIEDPEITGL